MQEVKEVLAHYDVGKWQTVQTLEGRNSCNVVLDTSAGKKLLKRYYGPLESTIEEHFVINHLSELDFPCPKLERNDQGTTYCCIGDKHYAIYEFVEGGSWPSCKSDPRLREWSIKSAAQTLARLDAAMSIIKVEDLPDVANLSGRRWPGRLEEHLHLVDQYTEMACRSSKRRSRQDALLGLSGEIKSGITEAWRYYQEAEPDMPKQVVHYDYAPKNLIFDNGRVIAVLDFGEVRVDFRASDVVRGLTSFAGMMRYDMDWRTAAMFLQTYRLEFPLYEKEIESLSDLMRWRILGSIIRVMEICLKTDYRPDMAGFYRDPETFIRKKLESMSKLKEQRAEIQRFLVKAASS